MAREKWHYKRTATQRIDRTKVCVTGKLRYRGRAAARVALRRLRVEQRTDALEMYLCPSCDGWHLGRRRKVQ
jgi:hypothetical protein